MTPPSDTDVRELVERLHYWQGDGHPHGLQIIGVVATLVGGAFFLGCALVALRRRQWSTAAFYGYVGMLGIGFGVCFGGLL